MKFRKLVELLAWKVNESREIRLITIIPKNNRSREREQTRLSNTETQFVKREETQELIINNREVNSKSIHRLSGYRLKWPTNKRMNISGQIK